MNKSILFAVFVLGLLFQGCITSYASTIEYPANQKKAIPPVDQFYDQINKEDYREYKDATYSIRKKLLYKDVPDFMLTFNKKIGRYWEQPKMELAEHISPNRQFYFFGSFYQTNLEEFYKFTVIDAETKARLYGGKGYHKFDNPYKN